MADRAAIVTGASSGIGLAIARMLGEEGYGLTVAVAPPGEARGGRRGAARRRARRRGRRRRRRPTRRPSSRSSPPTASASVASTCSSTTPASGIGAPVAEIETKRSTCSSTSTCARYILFYRECADLLRAAGAEHRNALVVNTASIAGKRGQAWLSVYSATKFGVVGLTQAMNKELGDDGIKSCALCPGFVDTAMTEFVKDQVPAEEMIQPQDIAEVVRTAAASSPPACVVPEIVFQRPDEVL